MGLKTLQHATCQSDQREAGLDRMCSRLGTLVLSSCVEEAPLEGALRGGPHCLLVKVTTTKYGKGQMC